MKKKEGKSSLILLTVCAITIFLTACGSASKGTVGVDRMVMEEAEAGSGTEVALNSSAVTMEGTALSQPVSTGRKLIRTVDLSVETENYDELMAGLEEQVSRLGGYIEYREAYYGNQYSSGNRNAHLQIRIPQNRVDEFTGRVKEKGNVTRENEAVEDVTLAYVDLESHKKMLLTEQQRLMELLERAETIEDIIALESRLSEVRYQIESMETQLRTYDNLVDYSTINLYIEEVERYTPQPEMGTWERIQKGFSDNAYRVGKGLKNFCVEFVISLPVLAVWAAAILMLILAVRLFSRWKRRHKNQDRDEAAKKTKVHIPPLRTGKKQEKNEKNYDRDQ